MTTREEIINSLHEMYEDEEFVSGFVLADGFEDAFIGTTSQCSKEDCVAYDLQRCLKILVDRDDMCWLEAAEYFDFNVAGAYVGERTPVFINHLTA
jgi:hypothetical protein